ncbi:MAG: nitroreductase family protein [Syntrophomonadaceae bacterium]|nr:nitroreductase family protein [Syntrophomonadaceae bacterium]
MEINQLEELIKTRRSIRKWQDQAIPDALLEKALELATWAPNGGNHQAWHFYVVKSRSVINSIAEAVEARTELMAGWPEAGPHHDTVVRWKKTSGFFRHAPVLIAVTVGRYQSITDVLVSARKDFDHVAAEIYANRQFCCTKMQNIAAAITNMLLAFHQLGLGACWMTGPAQAKQEIEKILGIPQDYEFAALIPVGFPREQPEPLNRKPLSQVVTVIG